MEISAVINLGLDYLALGGWRRQGGLAGAERASATPGGQHGRLRRCRGGRGAASARAARRLCARLRGKTGSEMLRSRWRIDGATHRVKLSEVVSEIRGHSKISTTLDVYSHVSLELQQQATAKPNAALTGRK